MDKKLKRALFPKRTSWVINKILMDTYIPFKIFEQATKEYILTLNIKGYKKIIMYTYEYDKSTFQEEYYSIYDPNHRYICSVSYEEDAQALISHLNRE